MATEIELPFAEVLWQPRPGSYLLTIACKATFDLRPGKLMLAATQEPVNTRDSFWNDDEARSLAMASDLVPSKPKVEFLLVGSAFAPENAPQTCVKTRVRFGSIDKQVDVFSERSLARDGTLTVGPPFKRMPLVFERAAGGPGTSNPVGIGADARDAEGRRVLPNVVRAGASFDFQSPIEVAGYGPLAASWPERAARVGAGAKTLASTWMKDLLPVGLDLGFFNAAPADQQLDDIFGAPELLLVGLHREHERLETALPNVTARVVVHRGAGSEQPQMRADTLLVDSNRGLAIVTWRGHVALQRPDESHQISAQLIQRQESWRTVQAPTPGNDAATESAPRTVRRQAATIAASHSFGSALPFQNVARGVERKAAMEGLPFGSPAPGPASAPSHAQPITEPPAAEPASGPVTEPPAAPQASWAERRPAPATEPPPAFVETPRPQTRHEAPRVHQGDVLQLLWLIGEASVRIRRNPVWKRLLDGLEDAQLDPELDEPALGEDEGDSEDRREIYELLARGEPAGLVDVERALTKAVRPDGRFAPQLLLLHGELEFAFDELEVLKASVSALTPIEGGDELKRELETAVRFLGTPGLVASSEVVGRMNGKLREAFARSERSVDESYLPAQIERALLERRAFQRRSVLGAQQLRAGFHFAGSFDPIPTYLPEILAKRLPLFRRFRLRLLAEAHFQADQYETHPVALKAVAIARVVR